MIRYVQIGLMCVFGLLSGTVMAQTYTLSGQITDRASGESLPGANVFVPELQRGATTDIRGSYSMSIPAGSYTLVASYVGYQRETFEIEITSDMTLNIELESDLVGLDQILVVGYGTRARRDITGSVARVGAAEIEHLPMNTIEQVLQGRTAGVFVEAGTGKLGQGIQMRIRGASSVTANNQPLFVIDGVPVTQNSQSITTSETNPLADLNFNDVESIEILKDASAAAIYGSRASNGVVLITTKQGRAGPTQINYVAQVGFSEPTRRLEWLNTDEYVELMFEAAANTDRILGTGQVYQNFLRGRMDLYAVGTDWEAREVDIDWQSEAFQDARLMSHELSFRGGTDRLRFYASGNYSDQDGIMIGNFFRRLGGRLNLDHNATDRLTLGLNFSLAQTENDRVPADNLFATPLQLVAQPPHQPVIDPNTGDLNHTTLYYNSLLDAHHAYTIQRVFRNLTNAYATFEAARGLSLHAEFGFDLLNQNEDRWWGGQTFRSTGAPRGTGQSRWVQISNYNTSAFATLNRTFQRVHDLEVLGGVNYQQSHREVTNATARDFPTDDFKKLTSAAEVTGGSSTADRYTFLSYFARSNYKYNNRYLLTLSGRIDGSSRFGVNSRYGFFPAAAVAWVASEEGFLADSRVLPFLKFRASVGVTGNAEIGEFMWRALYVGTDYHNIPGLTATQPPNPDLRWEQTIQYDLGVDFGLFDSRLIGEIDVYQKNTTDLLLNVNVPAVSGYTTQLRNVGTLTNQGIEISLTSFNFTGDFSWSTTFNISHNRNEITDLDGQNITGGFVNRAVEGQPIGVFFTREYAGVNPDNGDALYYLNRDPTDDELADGITFLRNGRYVVGNDDYGLAEAVVIGSPHPDFTGGLTNNFSYRGLDLNFLMQFVSGNDVYFAGGRFMRSNGDWLDNQTKDQMQRWRNPGDVTDVPEARFLLANGADHSSRYLYDGSYLRLKSVTLGYTLPANLTRQANIDRLRIYVQGVNLLTFTGYDGWDPEVNTDFITGNISLGTDFYSAPQTRTFTLGVDVRF